MDKPFLDEKTVKAAESVLQKGQRVELIPVKDGVKVVRVRREEVKPPGCINCKAWNRCVSAAREGKVAKCICFGYMQDYIRNN